MSTPTQTAELATSSTAWKEEISAKVSAHRRRRGAFAEQQTALPGMEPVAPGDRAARVAAKVAERYSKAPSYSEVLAAEAAKAARAAEAAADAARQAHAAAQAVTDVLWAGLDSSSDLEFREFGVGGAMAEPPNAAAPQSAAMHYHVDPASLPVARRTVLPQPEPRAAVEPHPSVVDPFEEALVAPAQPLPARVLEFPRELVAARKARPRIAEGPLHDADAEPEKGQLRIFEVEPEAICHEPSASVRDEAPVVPEWSSIRLDAEPRIREAELSASSETVDAAMPEVQVIQESHDRPFSSRAPRRREPVHSTERMALLAEMLPLHVAPMEDRMMAAIVDAVLVMCAFLLFVLVFVACTIHPPTGKMAMVAAGLTLGVLAALYQWLFFTFAEGTPGMHYAKIALCTFDDENPDRRAMRNRVLATLLSVLPLGLGLLWALLDDDRLGWHDRMTRTYQRSYR